MNVPTFVLILLLALPLAGCFGDEPVTEAATEEPRGDASAETARDESPPARDPGPANAKPKNTTAAPPTASGNATAPPPAEERVPPEEPVLRALPLSLDGALPTFVEPCFGTPIGGDCVAVPLEGEFQNRFPLGVTEAIVAGVLTLTWEAEHEANGVLTVSLHSIDADGAALEEFASAVGPSPLVLTLEAPIALGEGAVDYRIGVGKPMTIVGSVAGFAGARAGTAMTFHVEGLLSLMES